MLDRIQRESPEDKIFCGYKIVCFLKICSRFRNFFPCRDQNRAKRILAQEGMDWKLIFGTDREQFKKNKVRLIKLLIRKSTDREINRKNRLKK